jgi:hypothetical protein
LVQLTRVAIVTAYSKQVNATLISVQGGSWIPGGIVFNTKRSLNYFKDELKKMSRERSGAAQEGAGLHFNEDEA